MQMKWAAPFVAAVFVAVPFVAIPFVASGQTGTQIDLKSQTRRVDFTNAASTRPLKMGTTLPATCLPGDLFFKADAPSGANLFGCSDGNIWTTQGSANIQVQSDVTLVGNRATENITPGAGIVNTLIDNGVNITVQHSVDNSVMETRANLQAGVSLLCASQSNSGNSYACSLNPVLMAYTAGMVLHWRPDVAGAGGPTTLNVDGLGNAGVKMRDGSDPTAADIAAGSLYSLWYDGSAFRMQTAPGMAVASVRPSCSAALQGRLWLTAGGTGVKDTVAVCAKDAAESFGWRAIY